MHLLVILEFLRTKSGTEAVGEWKMVQKDQQQQMLMLHNFELSDITLFFSFGSV